MKLLSFGCKNFMGYREAQVTLRGGLVLVEGVNKDFATASSNGSGKSTLCGEIISYALFGRTLRNLEREGIDKVVHGCSGNVPLHSLIFPLSPSGEQAVTAPEEGAEVWAVVGLNGEEELEVRRYRNHKTHANKIEALINGADIRGRTADDTDKNIVKALGFDFDLFRRVVVIHSELTESTGSLTDKFLKDISERLLGLTDAGLPAAQAKTALTKLDADLTEVAGTLETIRSWLVAARGEIETLTEKRSVLRAQTKTKRERLARETKETQAAIDAKMREVSDVEVRVDAGKKRLRLFKDRIELQGKKVSEMADEHTKLITAEALANQDVVRLQLQERKYASFAVGAAVCVECGQSVGRVYAQSRVSELLTTIKSAKTAHQVLKGNLVQMNEEYQQKRKSLSTLEAELNKLAQTTNNEEYQVHAVKKELVVLRAKAAGLVDDLEAVEADPYESLIKDAKDREIKHTKAILALEQKQLALQDERPYLEFWCHGFGPAGIRSYVLDGATPFLDKMANTYLGFMTDDTMRVNLSTVTKAKDDTYRDKFSITVENAVGAPGLAGNSSGERACVDLALNLAMSDLLDNRIPGGVGLLFLDQVLDLMDEARGARAVKLLEQRLDTAWCATQGIAPKANVFVITHREPLKDMFAQVLRVEKEAGVCHVLS